MSNNTELDPNSASKNFDQKLYFAPESYHALRRELQINFPTMWSKIGGALFWDPPTFFAYMAEALDMIHIQFDSKNVDGLCKKVLDELRKARGLKPLHNESEYYLVDSQKPHERVVVENGTIIGTTGDINAKREI